MRLVGYTFLPGFMILTLLMIYGLIAVDLVQRLTNSNPNSEFSSSPLAWIIIILLPALLTWVAISLHVSRPSIHVREDSFRLETPLYRSNWFSWADITNIKTIRAPLSSESVYVIESDQLSPFFRLAALNANVDNRAFVIGNDIDQLHELIAYMERQRPDLFKGDNKT